MNAHEVQAALQAITTEPVNWTSSDVSGSVYVGDEDNIDAIIVIGEFPSDPAAEVDTVKVGLNGAEEQEPHTQVETIVAAVARLLARPG